MMENNVNNILDESSSNQLKIRRRSLLPLWIKIFIWLFVISGFITPFGLILGLVGFQFPLSLYGLSTYEPLSLVGLFISALFFLKGITAISLWSEKDWAINLALIDSLIGVFICFFMMIIYPFFNLDKGLFISFRLEILFLAPFIIKLEAIKRDWKKSYTIKDMETSTM